MNTLTPDIARRFVPVHPSQLSDLQLSAVLFAGDILESYLALSRAEATRRLKSGVDVDGWELVPTPGKRSIPDTVLAARQLAPLLEPHQILECATLALGKVQNAIKEAEGCNEAEAKNIMADYLKTNLVKGPGGEKLQSKPKTIELRSDAPPTLNGAGEVGA